MFRRSIWILALSLWTTAAPAADGARQFVHPTRGYVLNVPEGAAIEHRSQGADVEIRAELGWAVVIQTQSAKATIGTSESVARLEDLYLGPGRPWSRKVDLGASVVAGLPAFDAVYDGFGTRFRVVIARGADSEYLFILRTPPERFEAAMQGFRALMDGFRPGPRDMVARTDTFIRQAALPPAIPRSRQAPQRLTAGEGSSLAHAPGTQPDAGPMPTIPPPSAAPVETAVAEPEPPPPPPSILEFSEPRLGYVIDYKPDWIYEIPSDSAVMFSGRDDTDAYWATVSIQNVAPPDAESTMHAVSMIVDQLQEQFSTQAPDVVFESAGPYVYHHGAAFLLGREFFAVYGSDGTRYRQWSVVLPRPKGHVAHIWTYRAPAERFDIYLPVAEAMLRSWRIEDRG